MKKLRVKNNKNIKKRIHLNINDYKEYSEKYSSIEIEIKPVNNKYGKFINIKEDQEEIFAVKLEDKKVDTNVKEPENIILNKINELKSKKKKDKGKSNNNTKKLKNNKNINNPNEFIGKANIEINNKEIKNKKIQNNKEAINNINYNQSKISDNIIDEKIAGKK